MSEELTRSKAVLVIVDMQERLMPAMSNAEQATRAARIIAAGTRVLDIPVIVTEQNPSRLGPTLAEIAAEAEDSVKLEKLSFSCCGAGGFLDILRGYGRSQVLLAGIETHVCIYQTARDLLAEGLSVQLVADAITSRLPEHRELAMRRMESLGASITSSEMALFEMLGVAEGDAFKAILNIVR